MKKLLSFLIILLPWYISFFILAFINNNNSFLLFYIGISSILYIAISYYIYNTLKNNIYKKDFLLNIVLLYLVNQSYNFLLFYYNNLFSSTLFAISEFLIVLKIFINDKSLVEK